MRFCATQSLSELTSFFSFMKGYMVLWYLLDRTHAKDVTRELSTWFGNSGS
jgi:hypothetical protein